MKFLSSNLTYLFVPGFIVLIAVSSAHAVEALSAEQKAAEVNGIVISMKDLNNEYRQALKQRGTAENDISAEQALEFKKELLNSLIDQELLFQESKKKNIVVEEAVVDDSIAKVKEKYENEDAFQKAMKDANLQGDELKERVRRSLAINMLVDEQIRKGIVITDEESRHYYDSHPDTFLESEQVKASHILVKVDKGDGEAKKVAAKEKIAAIQSRLKEGEDFGKLARENSDCPSSVQGGDLGYFKKGAMVKEFEDAAFALAPDSVSDIVETQFGYHLIKVVDKKDAGAIPYETVKNDLENYLKRQKLTEEVFSLLETLRKDAKIAQHL